MFPLAVILLRHLLGVFFRAGYCSIRNPNPPSSQNGGNLFPSPSPSCLGTQEARRVAQSKGRVNTHNFFEDEATTSPRSHILMFLALTSGNTPQSLSLATSKSEVDAATDGEGKNDRRRNLPSCFAEREKAGFFFVATLPLPLRS